METAYNKLAAKWQGYFERTRDNGDHGDSNATPLPGKGQRRSLFQKHDAPSRPQARPAALPCGTARLLYRVTGYGFSILPAPQTWD